MEKKRLFIAGRVIGLNETERAEMRDIANDAAELFSDALDYDVINPDTMELDCAIAQGIPPYDEEKTDKNGNKYKTGRKLASLMDDPSDPKDVLCKYIRLMLDCDTILLFDDEPCDECTAAAQIAIARNMFIIRENKGLVCQYAAVPVIRAIGKVLELEFKDYAGVRSRAQIVAYARAIFAYWCSIGGMRYEDITACLHIPSQNVDGDEYSPLSRRKIAKYWVNTYQDMRSSDNDFNTYAIEIEHTLSHDRDFKSRKKRPKVAKKRQ